MAEALYWEQVRIMRRLRADPELIALAERVATEKDGPEPPEPVIPFAYSDANRDAIIKAAEEHERSNRYRTVKSISCDAVDAAVRQAQAEEADVTVGSCSTRQPALASIRRRLMALSERLKAVTNPDGPRTARVLAGEDDLIRAAAVCDAVQAFQAAEQALRDARQAQEQSGGRVWHAIDTRTKERDAAKARLLEVNLG